MDNEKKGLAWWWGLITTVVGALVGYLTHGVIG